MPLIKFACTKCHASIEAGNEFANQLINCPACNAVTEVPTKTRSTSDGVSIELVALCESIISDGELTYDEVYQLAEWLNNHREACENWPGNQIVKPLQEVWADGKLTKTELKRIGKLLVQIAHLWAQHCAENAKRDDVFPAWKKQAFDLSTAKLPMIPVTVRVQSHSDVGTVYEVDLSSPSCSCPDWMGKRRRLPVGHLSRCCKHVIDAYNQAAPENGWPGWIGAFFMHGWKPHPEQEWGVIGSDGDIVLYSTGPNGWADVYAKSEGLYERYGYNVNENRWSYGVKPENGYSIACAIIALNR